jgi:hypothetical protein
MGRKIIFLIFAILLVSVVSADMVLNQQPREVYNLGEVINLPIKIIAYADMTSFFSVELLCNGEKLDLPLKDIIVLSMGEEKQLSPSIPLIKSIIGNTTGICRIKPILGEDYLLTDGFRLSRAISIDLKNNQTEFSPGEILAIEGEAKKESGELVNGFVYLTITNDDLSKVVEFTDTVHGGLFSMNLPLPKDMGAGQHSVHLEVYEKDMLGETTNQGDSNYNIMIKQIPTNLEIVSESQKIEPGTSVKVKAILHDQTGQGIDSNVFITIEDGNRKIIEQTEKKTDEFLEIPIAHNEPPAKWTINATSNGLTTEGTFTINSKEEAKVELINDTVFLTNIGNVPYNKILLVKINNESLNINASIGVDEIQAYVLTAPKGEYRVEISSNGKNQIATHVALTGKEIDVRKASDGTMSLMAHPIVWVFIIAIFGSMVIILFRKGYQRTFFEHFKHKKNKKDSFDEPKKEMSLAPEKNKAELSLSIQGEKQDVSVVCLKIKNAKELHEQKGNAGSTIQHLITLAEINKAYTYENADNLIFIFSPVKTRTFRNEKSAIEVANKLKEILLHHNKIYHQKIDFGISVTYGPIVAKQESQGLKFMSMGTLITNAKKISSIAESDVLLGESIIAKLSREIKTEKRVKDGINVYVVKEIKNFEEGKKYSDNLAKSF